MRKNNIREFVLARLNEGADAMQVYREAQARFGHCGWQYVLKLRKERLTNIARLAREEGKK